VPLESSRGSAEEQRSAPHASPPVRRTPWTPPTLTDASPRLPADSCQRLEWLHDRMPAILRTREAQQAWLRPCDKGDLG
jgi:hypothetical protein